MTTLDHVVPGAVAPTSLRASELPPLDHISWAELQIYDNRNKPKTPPYNIEFKIEDEQGQRCYYAGCMLPARFKRAVLQHRKERKIDYDTQAYLLRVQAGITDPDTYVGFITTHDPESDSPQARLYDPQQYVITRMPTASNELRAPIVEVFDSEDGPAIMAFDIWMMPSNVKKDGARRKSTASTWQHYHDPKKLGSRFPKTAKPRSGLIDPKALGSGYVTQDSFDQLLEAASSAFVERDRRIDRLEAQCNALLAALQSQGIAQELPAIVEADHQTIVPVADDLDDHSEPPVAAEPIVATAVVKAVARNDVEIMTSAPVRMEDESFPEYKLRLIAWRAKNPMEDVCYRDIAVPRSVNSAIHAADMVI